MKNVLNGYTVDKIPFVHINKSIVILTLMYDNPLLPDNDSGEKELITSAIFPNWILNEKERF